MALKHRCPSCGDLTMQIADHEFRTKGVIILWRICESCGHIPDAPVDQAAA